MNVEERISKMHADDLERLLSTLNFALSGSTIGETEAFEFLAEIEALAIKARKSRVANAFDLLVEALGTEA